jgi:hypothetical protein
MMGATNFTFYNKKIKRKEKEKVCGCRQVLFHVWGQIWDLGELTALLVGAPTVGYCTHSLK